MAKTVTRLDDIEAQTRTLADTIEESVAELAAQIASLNERYRRLTGTDIASVEINGGNGSTKRGPGRPSTKQRAGGESTAVASSKGGKGAKRKRVRRNADQLKAQADNILTFIKKGGPEGVKGSAIRAEFGPILPSVKAFVKQYSGKTVKTKGQKAGMTYHGE